METSLNKPENKVVHFYVRPDGRYLSYLPKHSNPDHWIWDGEYRTREEFEKEYKEYEKVQLSDADK